MSHHPNAEHATDFRGRPAPSRIAFMFRKQREAFNQYALALDHPTPRLPFSKSTSLATFPRGLTPFQGTECRAFR